MKKGRKKMQAFPLELIGWFDASGQTVASYDPLSAFGLVRCACCERFLAPPEPARTVSLLWKDRSYFYRRHPDCPAVDDKVIDLIEASELASQRIQ